MVLKVLLVLMEQMELMEMMEHKEIKVLTEILLYGKLIQFPPPLLLDCFILIQPELQLILVVKILTVL